jgi:hypothetical protein
MSAVRPAMLHSGEITSQAGGLALLPQLGFGDD